MSSCDYDRSMSNWWWSNGRWRLPDRAHTARCAQHFDSRCATRKAMNMTNHNKRVKAQTAKLALRMLHTLAAEMCPSGLPNQELAAVERTLIRRTVSHASQAAADAALLDLISRALLELFGRPQLLAILDNYVEYLQPVGLPSGCERSVELRAYLAWRDSLDANDSDILAFVGLYSFGSDAEIAWGMHHLVVVAADLVALAFEDNDTSPLEATNKAHEFIVDVALSHFATR